MCISVVKLLDWTCSKCSFYQFDFSNIIEHISFWTKIFIVNYTYQKKKHSMVVLKCEYFSGRWIWILSAILWCDFGECSIKSWSTTIIKCIGNVGCDFIYLELGHNTDSLSSLGIYQESRTLFILPVLFFNFEFL